MKVIGMIPVRMESSRLPAKAMADICGTPMILHTLKRSQMSKCLDAVYVATDSPQIAELIQKNGGQVIMTSSAHPCGTNRIAEACQQVEADLVVNIQGDEALVMPEHIDAGVQGLNNTDVPVSILLTRFSKKNSQSDVKAVVNLKNEIMYFSRTDLPSDARSLVSEMYKAYHVVSFRKSFLLEYAKMSQTPLEKIEYNEYLRILENGYKIQGVVVNSDAVSVDTQSDLEYVRSRMANDSLYAQYRTDVLLPSLEKK